MTFTAKQFNEILGIDDSYKAPEALLKIMLDSKKRSETLDLLLENESILDRDWFVDYFQEEHAERKRFDQDFTPISVTNLLSGISGSGNTYFESAAGTGGLMVSAWNKHRIDAGPARFDPRKYWYQVEELSDRSIPFLLLNMSIRGMNGVALHGDSLTNEFKNLYFVRNDTSDFLVYSEIHVIDIGSIPDIDKEWLGISQKESG